MTLKNLKNEIYKCEFCNKIFKTISGFEKHSCKLKLRWTQRNELFFKRAFAIYIKFCSFVYRNSKKNIKIDDFIKSTYYENFIKLSLFVYNGLIAFPDQYCDYLFKNNIKAINWNLDTQYQIFLLNFYKNDKPEDAMERTVNFIGKWAEDRNLFWTDFCNDITPTLAVEWIYYGKISPWFLYCGNMRFGIKIINRLSDEQLNIISKIIDPLQWNSRIITYEHKIDDFIEILTEQGM